MREPVRATKRSFTYADYLTWPDEERWEIIEGVAYDMTPAPSTRHQGILIQLITQFASFLEDSPCRPFAAPFDVLLPKPSEEASTSTTVVQPDLLVVCEREKLKDYGCVGAPTLVLEILSPSTSTKDLREKLHAYERAGVPEYWVVSPAEKWVQIFTLNSQGRYDPPATFGDGEQAPVGVLPGLIIDLGRVFAER